MIHHDFDLTQTNNEITIKYWLVGNTLTFNLFS